MNKKDYPEEYIKDSVMGSQKMREDLLRAIRAKENMKSVEENIPLLIEDGVEKVKNSEPYKMYRYYKRNDLRDLNNLRRLWNQGRWTVSMNDDAKKEAFKKEMLDDTAKYIKKYGLDKNQAEEDKWMNDTFRHTYGSAIMGIRGGGLGARLGGIFHEKRPNNPFDEWKMDVWNNKEGRKIARDLKKEYGQALYEMSDEELKDLIASRVVEKMQKNELISDPSDKRRYEDDKLETFAYDIQNNWFNDVQPFLVSINNKRKK